MLKNIIINIVLIFLITACKREIPIEGFDAEVWKNDRLGCKGERDQLVPVLLEQREEILGLTEADILKTLGRPDFQELSKRNQKFYFYHVVPGSQCENGLSGEKENTFQIRFNSIGYANEIMMNRI